MPTQRKSDAARANGAKSRGPVTLEGKRISSSNAVRHGLTAKAVVLPGESQEEFQFLLDSYIDQFHPATGVESELVQTMAVARWRLNRIVGVETNLFNNQMAENSEYVDIDRLAHAFKELAEGPTLTLLLRYEGTLTRTYDRAFKQLDQLQRARRSLQPMPPEPPQPNEPKPVVVRVPSPPLEEARKPKQPLEMPRMSPGTGPSSQTLLA